MDPEAFELDHDEALLAPEDDPIEEPIDISDGDSDDDPEEDDERDIEMHLPSPERTPTPPPAPMSPLPTEEETSEESVPAHVEMELADDPAPPPPPLAVVPLALYEWMTSHYAADLTAAEARVAELRLQLTAEREARQMSQGGRVDGSTRRMRSAMRRIEERALNRVRRLSPLRGPVDRSEVARVLSDAMRRVRDATRVRGR